MNKLENFSTHLIILAFLTLYAIFLLKIYPPLASFDSYFHLAVGREVAKTHQIPTIDTFTFVGEGKEWISNEWLSGYFIFLIYSNFGEAGILALRASFGVLTLLFLFLTLRAQKINFLLSILTVGFVGLTLSVRMLDRPEMMSFTLFSFLVYLLILYTLRSSVYPEVSRRVSSVPLFSLSTLYLCPIVPIFIIWPNIQGYAPIGLAVFAYFVIRNLLPEKLDAKLIFKKIKEHKFLILAFLLSAAAALLQFKRFLYFLFLNKELFGYVSEVRPIFANLEKIKYNFFFNIPIEYHLFFIFLIVTIFSFFVRKRQGINRQLVLDAIFVFALCLLAFQFSRMIATFILLTSPIVAINLKNWLKDKEIYLWAPLCVLILIMLFSIYQGKLFQERASTLYIFDKDNNIRVATSTTWKERRPTQALNFIKNNLEPQRLMTSLNWSNQALWKLENKTKVMLDIIYEKQTKESFGDYQKLAQNQGDIAEVVNKYAPDVIINTQPQNLAVPFEPQVYKISGWDLVYIDEVTQVYAKNQPNLALRAIHPEFPGELKFRPEQKESAEVQLKKLLEIDPANSFAKSQLILLLLLEKNYKGAEALARQSIKLSPKNPQYYLLLATSQIPQKNCFEAQINAKKAKKLAGGYIFIREQAQSLIEKCK